MNRKLLLDTAQSEFGRLPACSPPPEGLPWRVWAEWGRGWVRATLFVLALFNACGLGAQVNFSLTNPSYSDTYAYRLTDAYGSAEDGYPSLGGVVYVVGPKSTVQFTFPAFSYAVLRVNTEPHVPDWAGYEVSTSVTDAASGAYVVAWGGSVYKSDALGALSAEPALDWELFEHGFWWSLSFGMAFLLFWVVRRMNFGGINHNQP